MKPTGKNKKQIKNKMKSSDDVLKLNQAIEEFEDPAASVKEFSKFESIMSKQTLEGLRKSHFVEMTDIQRKSIIPSAKGQDILGAARTGSGKTLAFLIPVLEALYRKQWHQYDGLGALIISPTRELAIQIYHVLCKIGREHSFSVGLIIGGKDVRDEAARLSRINILIGTPGRILQHMDQTAGFDTSNLQILVLDEADRILDMGFKKSMDAIVENLPKERQTLLFSATQTKSVSDLARLSLSDPTYISVHEQEENSTPKSLKQVYIKIDLDQKLNFLYYFIRTHLNSKVLVFLSSSKQVRFVYETFRTMRPGISLLHLHGKQKQTARIEVTAKFSSSQHVCLFATDIVARGIDFPAVDWIVQVDAPEDASTYIHRVGRSARFDKAGNAVLLVTPKEAPGMIEEIRNRKVPIQENKDPKLMPMNLGKQVSTHDNNNNNIKKKEKLDITLDMQNICFKEPEIKYLGQKAFISYVRSVYVQKNKQIFNIEDLPLDKFAKSLGLPGTPKIKVGGVHKLKEAKNAPRQLLTLTNESDDETKTEKNKVRTKYDRMFERKNQSVLSDHYMNVMKDKNDSDGEEGFMSIKATDQSIDDLDLPDLQKPASKRQAKMALSKKLSVKNKGNPTKLKFDDDGNPHATYEFEDEVDFQKAGDSELQKQQFLQKEAKVMEAEDVEDKQIAKTKRQEKKRRRQEAERKRLEDDDDDSEDGRGYQVYLGREEPNIDEDYESSDDDEPQSKRVRWFDKGEADNDSNILEVEEPTTIEDMESLASRLLSHRK